MRRLPQFTLNKPLELFLIFQPRTEPVPEVCSGAWRVPAVPKNPHPHCLLHLPVKEERAVPVSGGSQSCLGAGMKGAVLWLQEPGCRGITLLFPLRTRVRGQHVHAGGEEGHEAQDDDAF